MKTNFIRRSTCLGKLLLFLLISSVLFNTAISVQGQCIATAMHSGANAVNDNSVGTLAFSATGNVYASDNQRTIASAAVSLFTGNSNYLKVTGFGFNIPSYSSICGVEVQIEKRAQGIILGAWIRDHSIRLVKAGTVTGNNVGNTSTDWATSDAYYTYGGANDQWGESLTPEDVNNPDFGVAISAGFNGLLGVFPAAEIDHIRMIIYHNPVLPVRIISFQSSLHKNIVKLNWETSNEEDGEIITVQRNVNGQNQWTDIARYYMSSNNSKKKYTLNDSLTEKGNYSYRLQIITVNGAKIYSETRHIRYSSDAGLNVYPNPAAEYIIIENIADPKQLSFSNLSRQLIQLPIRRIDNNSVWINIQKLPAGLYIASAGRQQIKFAKH